MYPLDDQNWLVCYDGHKRRKEENMVIVAGFVRNIQIGKQQLIPSTIIDLCCNYNFIDMSSIFDNNKLWFDTLLIAKNACYAYNFLLSEEICLQFIYHNHEEKCAFHNILGMVYARMRLTEKAENEYKLSIQLAPQNDIYLWNYSTLLRQLSRYKDAALLLKRAMDMSPDDISYNFEYAKCLELTGDEKYKNEYLEKYEWITFILTLTGGSINKKYQIDAKNHLYKAICHKILDNMEYSECEYEKYLDSMNLVLLTENITAFARLLYLLEKYDEALVMIDTAIKRGRSNPFTFYYHALIMKIKGYYKLSKESFEKALNLSAHFVKCQQELTFLA